MDPRDGGLWITGHDTVAQVFKVSIPEPTKSRNWEELIAATMLEGPHDYMDGCAEQDNWHFSGIEFLYGRLDGICKYWYNVTGSDLNTFYKGTAAAIAASGPFHVGPQELEYASAKVGAYLFAIPEDFARAAGLGSKIMVTGFAREAGAFGGSQGPTLIAFDPNNPRDAIDLVRYRFKHPSCPTRDCDYPEYTSCDSWDGGTWVRSQNGPAILIGGEKGLGPTRYGGGEAGDCSPYQGYHCDPYENQILFYDPADVAKRIRGELKPWKVIPYEIWRPEDLWSESCGTIGGMAFDAATNRLFIIERLVGPWQKAVVHIYQASVHPNREPNPDQPR